MFTSIIHNRRIIHDKVLYMTEILIIACIIIVGIYIDIWAKKIRRRYKVFE